jgi:hypothetical protein
MLRAARRPLRAREADERPGAQQGRTSTILADAGQFVRPWAYGSTRRAGWLPTSSAATNHCATTVPRLRFST